MRDKKESAAASVGQRRRQNEKKMITDIISQGKENVKYV